MLATLAGQVVSGHERGRLVSELFDNLQGSDGQPSTSLMAEDSVENIARRCGRLEESIASMDFLYMLNVIQFRTKVIMCVSIFYLIFSTDLYFPQARERAPSRASSSHNLYQQTHSL